MLNVYNNIKQSCLRSANNVYNLDKVFAQLIDERKEREVKLDFNE